MKITKRYWKSFPKFLEDRLISLFYFTHMYPYVSFFMYMIYAIIKLILIDFILGEGYG